MDTAIIARVTPDPRRTTAARPWSQVPTCPRCIAGPVMEWRAGNRYQCPHCELSIPRSGYAGSGQDWGWGI